MSNRRTFVGVAGFLAIVFGGFFFIWPHKTKQEAQPAAEKATTGSVSQIGPADPQQQVNELIHFGDQMMDDGDYVNARSYYERASKLDPSNTVARAGVVSAERAMAAGPNQGKK